MVAGSMANPRVGVSSVVSTGSGQVSRDPFYTFRCSRLFFYPSQRSGLAFRFKDDSPGRGRRRPSPRGGFLVPATGRAGEEQTPPDGNTLERVGMELVPRRNPRSLYRSPAPSSTSRPRSIPRRKSYSPVAHAVTPSAFAFPSFPHTFSHSFSFTCKGW